jgi:acyl dehydratase
MKPNLTNYAGSGKQPSAERADHSGRPGIRFRREEPEDLRAERAVVRAIPLSKNAADTDRVRARPFRGARDGSVKGGTMNTDTLSDQPVSPYVIHGVAGLKERAGSSLGTSRWVTVDQEMVTTFADLTGDRQWIHVDPERARQGPFGATVAHGFLTLGMSTGLLWDIFTVGDVGMILNYGLNRVRFPAPLPVGSRIRMHASLAEVSEIADGIQVVYHLEYEIEGKEKPCCVADLVFRYYT